MDEAGWVVILKDSIYYHIEAIFIKSDSVGKSINPLTLVDCSLIV